MTEDTPTPPISDLALIPMEHLEMQAAEQMQECIELCKLVEAAPKKHIAMSEMMMVAMKQQVDTSSLDIRRSPVFEMLRRMDVESLALILRHARLSMCRRLVEVASIHKSNQTVVESLTHTPDGDEVDED